MKTAKAKKAENTGMTAVDKMRVIENNIAGEELAAFLSSSIACLGKFGTKEECAECEHEHACRVVTEVDKTIATKIVFSEVVEVPAPIEVPVAEVPDDSPAMVISADEIIAASEPDERPVAAPIPEDVPVPEAAPAKEKKTRIKVDEDTLKAIIAALGDKKPATQFDATVVAKEIMKTPADTSHWGIASRLTKKILEALVTEGTIKVEGKSIVWF